MAAALGDAERFWRDRHSIGTRRSKGRTMQLMCEGLSKDSRSINHPPSFDEPERTWPRVERHVRRGGADHTRPLHRSAVRVGDREALDGILRAAQRGEGQALVVHGERGLGKTAMLEHHIDAARGFWLLRTCGVESEKDFSFAALHRFCASLLDGADDLPDPQRQALAVTFGESPGEADPLLLGLAVLGLLGKVSADQPVACLIDDAHWLDRPSARVLGFVARRIEAQCVAMFFAMTEPIDELDGLPELRLGRLSDAESRTFLSTIAPGLLDRRVRDRIIAEAQGIPRELLRSAQGSTPGSLAGGFGEPTTPPRGQISCDLQSRVEAVGPEARRFLLIAAAEPEGDPEVVMSAASKLEVDPLVVDEVGALGLIDVRERVAFCHPLLRSVVYHGADLDDRQRVHQALADATEPTTAVDRHAWHLAQATRAPQAEVADALERSVPVARSRSGLAGAAAFLERSALLTAEPRLRATRALEAAQVVFEAGSPAAASDLVMEAGTGPLDEHARARLDRLGAEIACALRGGTEAMPRLLEAATALEPLDLREARDTYLRAFEGVVFAHPSRAARHVVTLAEAARSAPRPAAPSAPDLLLDALTILFLDGYVAAVPTLRQAVDALSNGPDTSWLTLASWAAAELWDVDASRSLATRAVAFARDRGALTSLPVALDHLAALRGHAGDVDDAVGLIVEANTISDITGCAPVSSSALVVAAWRGDEAEATAHIDRTRRAASAKNNGRPSTDTRHAAALLLNGLGRYREALDAVEPDGDGGQLFPSWVLPELIEAAARSGEIELATRALERLTKATQLSGTDWALGIEARSAALVTDGPAAEQHHREAIERLDRCHANAHLARAHLVYGEWLRRQRRRVEAREQLRAAHDMFSNMGAAGFAARAHRDLLATGEHARKRNVETIVALTPREAQIAGLARDGHSNPEIGEKLFISARTVEYHLHKVFTKLGVTSRVHLARMPLP